MYDALASMHVVYGRLKWYVYWLLMVPEVRVTNHIVLLHGHLRALDAPHGTRFLLWTGPNVWAVEIASNGTHMRS